MSEETEYLVIAEESAFTFALKSEQSRADGWTVIPETVSTSVSPSAESLNGDYSAVQTVFSYVAFFERGTTDQVSINETTL